MKTAEPLNTIESFRDVLKNPSRVAAEWKAGGRKVAGYRCFYVPEEIIWASGMLPFPVYGTPEPVVLADSYFQSCSCEFIRNIFDLALTGKLDFLDCIVLSNTCDAVRKLYDMWSGYIGNTSVYMINNPQKLMSENNREYYLEELERFRAKTAQLSGNKVTDRELGDAIDLHNETRALLQEMNMLRKQDPPPLSGEEVLDICMAVSIMPKDRANPLLRNLLEEIKTRKVPERFGPRILVTGSIIDNPVLLRMVDDVGGIVAADDLCTTSRYFWGRVEKKSDPMDCLYRHLNTRPICACMHPIDNRINHILDLVEEFRIEAVIHFNLKYCHPFLYEAPLLKKELESRRVPVSILETGHDLSGLGQLRTRIQAFIEMVDL